MRIEHEMNSQIKSAARELAAAGRVVALTGAGVSVESGIPPFRGKGGLWEKIDPMEYAHIDAFRMDPAKVWQVLIREMKDVVDRARPNAAHLGLARLESLGILKTIITQNVDGLHQMAGNTDVIEFHGNFAWQRCLQCDHRLETRRIDLAQMPPRCRCGGIFRPECVFFGEMISPDDLNRSRQAAAGCDVMLVVGTSALVQPAAYMPVIAKRSGARIIEINAERTLLTRDISDLLLLGKAGEIFDRLLTEIEKLR
jgi:NAD-dependent deacetylase